VTPVARGILDAVSRKASIRYNAPRVTERKAPAPSPEAGLLAETDAAGGLPRAGEAPLLLCETIRNEAVVGERALWHDRRERISYSSCNEDSACETRALRPGPGKRLFCVTAGGGRVLDLVADGPDEVWAVDLNPSQNHLLELKMAGIAELSFAEYLAFLGIRPDGQRLATYARLRSRLSPEAQRYFDARKPKVRAGLIYQGLLERFFARVIAPIVRTVRPFWVRRLMAAQSVEEQRRLICEPCTRLWRALVGILCRRRFLDWFSGEAGFWRYIPAEISLHRRIIDRIFGHLENHLASNNHLVNLIFCGRYINEDALPPYLHPEPFARLRTTLGRTRMRLITGTVCDALHQAPAGMFDGFALSDIGSYLDDMSFRRLFEQVVRTGRKGARLCSRGILYHRELPAECAHRLRRDPGLEHEFARADASMVHDFLVGELL
jgi:S-adenosylmethionine-diacylglycerol 3-amino-3-carboxypropyl transferase